jgi:hypothetical protein
MPGCRLRVIDVSGIVTGVTAAATGASGSGFASSHGPNVSEGIGMGEVSTAITALSKSVTFNAVASQF